MRLAAVLVSALAASGFAWAGGDGNRLVLSGAFRTSSASTVSNDSSCGLKKGTLTFMSGAMRTRVGRHGPFVARVIFDLRSFHGVDGYDATRPLVEYGRTPLKIVTAPNGASGVASGFWLARNGTIEVRAARYVRGRLKSASGTIDGVVAYREGSLRLQGTSRFGRFVRLRGTWRCVEVVNG